MKKPILVVMAAGMGSRYGGLKQIDPVGPSGEVIMDFSVFDAKRAGFETVVFIIKKEIDEQFRELVGDRIAQNIEVRYAYQEVDNVPEGFEIPEGRVKPWGTGHAILSAKDVIDAPFAVINADDYYGRDAFKTMYDYLAKTPSEIDGKLQLAMVGYLIKNTVSDFGSVSRGVCVLNGNKLKNIDERKVIEKQADGIKFTLDDGKTWTMLKDDDIVSMNLFGFPQEFLQVLEEQFPKFLEDTKMTNPLKGEYLLPEIVKSELLQDKLEVEVLSSDSKWYGITYQEDRPFVVEALKEKVSSGEYPEKLWNE